MPPQSCLSTDLAYVAVDPPLMEHKSMELTDKAFLRMPMVKAIKCAALMVRSFHLPTMAMVKA